MDELYRVSTIMQFLKPALSVVTSKYVIVLAAFIIWMSFFDPKDRGLINARTERLRELNKSEKHLSGLIRETKKELYLLKSDAASIEKYAREKFFMKKDNEDLFIVRTP